VHHCTTLLGYIFGNKAHIDNWNKNSSGDELANVNSYAVRLEATWICWNNAK